MEVPLQVSYRGLDSSPAIDAAVRTWVARLEQVSDAITGCRVMVEVPHRRHRKGALYRIRIDMTVPGGELVVARNPAGHNAHEDFYVALRDAFRAARTELDNYVRRRRGEVKRHLTPSRGWVSKLFGDEGFGFIRTPDGREVYFHANSVHARGTRDGFDLLVPGDLVRFSEEPGDDGPHAVYVRLIRPQGH